MLERLTRLNETLQETSTLLPQQGLRSWLLQLVQGLMVLREQAQAQPQLVQDSKLQQQGLRGQRLLAEDLVILREKLRQQVGRHRLVLQLRLLLAVEQLPFSSTF